MNLLALVSILAALWLYIRSGASQIARLRGHDDPIRRRTFFIAKLQRQSVMFLVLPVLALIISQNFARAWHPDNSIGSLSQYIMRVTGLSANDLISFHQELFGPFLAALAIEMLVVIVAIEAIPILRKSRRIIALGNFAVLRARNPTELGLCLLLAINAGVGEELLFRGFIPAAFMQLGVAAIAAFLISVAIFGICHGYQGAVGVIATTVIGLVLTVLYLLSGSLLVVMAVHVAIDIVALVLRPATGMLLQKVLNRRVRNSLPAE